MDATFNLKQGDGLVEYFGWKSGEFHDVITIMRASCDGLENLGLLVIVANEAPTAKAALFLGIIIWE